MAGTVELGLPAIAMSLFADSLRSAGRRLALAVAPDAVKGGVGAADEVEVVNHDPRPRQLVVDRLPVGLIRVDRHDIDRCAAGRLLDHSAGAIAHTQSSERIWYTLLPPPLAMQ